MNTKNLILTDVKEMNREQWLEWRMPVNHCKNFIEPRIKSFIDSQLGTPGPEHEALPNKVTPDFLKMFFDLPEWKAFTFPCVGGSEIGTVLGLSPYKSVIEMFYEKVGLKEGFYEDNSATFWGKTLESTIAEKWQYWEGSPESMIENCNKEKIVRKCRRMNYYVQNKAFPWLFCSLDRVINKYSGKGEGALECKTMNGYVAKMWENGIPPFYVVQMQEQVLVTELDFAEMAVLIDGRDFQVYPFNKHEGIAERIKAESLAFHNRVKSGIECFLLWKASGDENYLVELDKHSPEPDGSTSYESYLNKAWKETGYEKVGGAVELHLAKAYKFFAEQTKQLDAMQRECSNKLKAFLKDGAIINFGQEGKVTWKADSRGTRTMRVSVKPDEGFKPDPELIKTEPLVPVEQTNVPRETKQVEYPVNRVTTEFTSTLPPGWE